MKRVISLLLATVMIVGATLSLTSCESIAKAMSAVLFEILTLGNGNEQEGGDEYEEGGDSEGGSESEGDGSGELPDSGDGEEIVLDPNLHENALTDEFLSEIFGGEYITVSRSRDMNTYDFLRDTDTIAATSFQYEYHQRFTQISRDRDGAVTEERVSEIRMASFYSDDEQNLRVYIYETSEGETDVIQYYDTALGRGYAVKHWAMGEGISHIQKDYLDNLYRLYLWDTLLSNLTDVESYGYAEDGEHSYYHLVFTAYGKETIDYDIYYRLDSANNTTAIYMKETIGGDTGEYQSIREKLFLPYDSYFDLPPEIYG